jgi:plastocyanin
MSRTALLVGACCLTLARAGAAQNRGAGVVGGGRVSGRITMLEKSDKPSPDLGSAVVSLEGTTGAGAGAPGSPATVEIAINDKTFVPRVVVVPVGSIVRFPNHDPFDHNVFSANEPDPFDLGQYGRGEARQRTFARPGLVRVFCNIHPRMVAFVQVMAGSHYTQPAADGSFTVDDVPAGRYTLRVWHERSPEATQPLAVGPAGAAGLDVTLDARGFRWVPHKNKYGKDYPTSAGRERY